MYTPKPNVFFVDAMHNHKLTYRVLCVDVNLEAAQVLQYTQVTIARRQVRWRLLRLQTDTTRHHR